MPEKPETQSGPEPTSTPTMPDPEVLFQQLFTKFKTPEERVAALHEHIDPLFDQRYISDPLLVGIDGAAMKSGIDALKGVTDEGQFVRSALHALDPLVRIRIAHPREFAYLQSRAETESKGFTVVNELIYYGMSGTDMHLHLSAAVEINPVEAMKIMRDGMIGCAEALRAHPEVVTVSATSWLVAGDPRMFEGLGFTYLGLLTEAEKQKHFKDEKRPVGKAVASREKFIKRFPAKEKHGI